MSLAVLVTDIGWTFILPLICFLSLIANLINICVLSKLRRHKNNTYNCLFLKSIINSIYLFLCFFVFLFRCGQFCSKMKNFQIVKFYQLYVFNYLTSCLGLYDLLIELIITVTRFLNLMRNNQLKRNSSNLILLGAFFISIIFYIPNIFCFKIIEDSETKNGYKIIFASANSLNLIEYIDMIGISIRGLLIIFLIVFINLLSFLKFNQNIKIMYNKTIQEINLSKNLIYL
jgi:hypothetical protein